MAPSKSWCRISTTEVAMSGLNWNEMKYELLRCGVKTKYITRTLSELKCHYADLKQQGINEGLTEQEADNRAKARIGDERTLLTEILSKPELRSVIWRFPRSVFAIGPSVAVISYNLITLVLAIGFATSTVWSEGFSPGMQISLWQKLLVNGVLLFNCYLLTPMVAIVTVILARQRNMDILWPALGVVVLAIIGSGWAYTIAWPDNTMVGNLSINWGYSFFPRAIRGDHDLQNFGQIAFTLVLTLACWRMYNPLRRDMTNHPV